MICAKALDEAYGMVADIQRSYTVSATSSKTNSVVVSRGPCERNLIAMIWRAGACNDIARVEQSQPGIYGIYEDFSHRDHLSGGV